MSSLKENRCSIKGLEKGFITRPKAANDGKGCKGLEKEKNLRFVGDNLGGSNNGCSTWLFIV